MDDSKPGSIDVDSRMVLSVDEVAALLGVSPRSVYKSAAKGELPSFRVGRRVVLPAKPLMRLLGEHDDSAGEE